MRKRNRVLLKPGAFGAAVAHRQFSKSLTWTRSSTRAFFPTFQNPEHKEAQLRVQLKTEEFMMTSMMESFRNWEAICNPRTSAGACSSKRNVAGNNSLWFLENRSNKTYNERCGAKHEDNSRENPLHHLSVLPPPGWIVRNPLRRWRKLTHHYRHLDPQKVTHGSKFDGLVLLCRTRFQSAVKVCRKERKQKNSNFRPGCKRQHFTHGKSMFAEKWCQDQLILDLSAIG